MIMFARPDRHTVTSAMNWTRDEIKRDPEHTGHLAALRDELLWQIERRESTLTALRNMEANHARVVPIRVVRQLLTEEGRR
jgi:hypothetical protein